MLHYYMARFDGVTDWCQKAIDAGYPFLVAYHSGCYIHGGTDLMVRDDLATCKRIKAPFETAFIARDNGRPVPWTEFSEESKGQARWRPVEVICQAHLLRAWRSPEGDILQKSASCHAECSFTSAIEAEVDDHNGRGPATGLPVFDGLVREVFGR